MKGRQRTKKSDSNCGWHLITAIFACQVTSKRDTTTLKSMGVMILLVHLAKSRGTIMDNT